MDAMNRNSFSSPFQTVPIFLNSKLDAEDSILKGFVLSAQHLMHTTAARPSISVRLLPRDSLYRGEAATEDNVTRVYHFQWGDWFGINSDFRH